MAKHSLSKNLHKLNFSRQQINAFSPIILIGYKMAELLNDAEVKKLSIKERAENLVHEWNCAISELVIVMLGSKKVN